MFRNKKNISRWIGCALALIHTCLFVMAAIGYINTPRGDGQRIFWFLPFIIIDFPPTLLFFPMWANAGWAYSVENPILRHLLFPLYWLYGPICAVWWYYLPRLFMPKTWGGMWGKNPRGIP